MAQQQRTDILFPVGRFVAGSCYKPRDKDAEGKPLVIKNGPDAGKPRVDYFVAVAYKKGTERAWWETQWGQQMMAAGQAAFPQAYASPAFAWKVDDGDSQVPNKKGRKPCENEGWPGHWVVKFSGGYAPKVCNADGSQAILEPDAVKPGYFVQVFGNVSGNGSISQPGIFVNHSAIALAGYGEEIRQGLDTSAVGFGGQALPAGASAVPIGAMTPPALPGAAVPGTMPTLQLPPAAGAPQMPTAVAPPTMPAVAPTMVAPTMVAPNPAILNVPVGTAVAPPPLAAPPVPAAPGPQLTPSGVAAGGSYKAFIDAGWNDAQLRQHGYLA